MIRTCTSVYLYVCQVESGASAAYVLVDTSTYSTRKKSFQPGWSISILNLYAYTVLFVRTLWAVRTYTQLCKNSSRRKEAVS